MQEVNPVTNRLIKQLELFTKMQKRKNTIQEMYMKVMMQQQNIRSAAANKLINLIDDDDTNVDEAHADDSHA